MDLNNDFKKAHKKFMKECQRLLALEKQCQTKRKNQGLGLTSNPLNKEMRNNSLKYNY